MALATSAACLPEMSNVQHRTEHHRLDEQQVDDHGVNIVNYGEWAHKQGLDLPQREDLLMKTKMQMTWKGACLMGCMQCIHC